MTFGPNLGVFPLEQTRHVRVAKSEHPRLTNGEIIFRRIPTYVITIHQRHRRTDRQTDRQTTCDRNTALCTKVHRAVKTGRKICRLGVKVRKAACGEKRVTQETYRSNYFDPLSCYAYRSCRPSGPHIFLINSNNNVILHLHL